MKGIGGHLKLTEIRQYLEKKNILKKKPPRASGTYGKRYNVYVTGFLEGEKIQNKKYLEE